MTDDGRMKFTSINERKDEVVHPKQQNWIYDKKAILHKFECDDVFLVSCHMSWRSGSQQIEIVIEFSIFHEQNEFFISN